VFAGCGRDTFAATLFLKAEVHWTWTESEPKQSEQSEQSEHDRTTFLYQKDPTESAESGAQCAQSPMAVRRGQWCRSPFHPFNPFHGTIFRSTVW
jgi:hypothetical protein